MNKKKDLNKFMFLIYYKFFKTIFNLLFLILITIYKII